MDFEEKLSDKCDKCGSFKPWVCIIKDNDEYESREEIKRKCIKCRILPIYKFINNKNIYINDKPLTAAVYEFDCEYDRYVILED